MYFLIYSVLDIIKLKVKEVGTVMCDEKKNTKENKLKSNIYFIFAEEKQNVRETIGKVFKDYLENLKAQNK